MNAGGSRPLSNIAATAIFVCILALYASSWVLSWVAIERAPPLWLVSVRLLAGLAGSIIVMMLSSHRQLTNVERSAKGGYLVLASLLGFGVFLCLTHLALVHIEPSELVLTVSMIPGITYLLGCVLHAERPSVICLCGLALSFAGAIMYAAPSLRAAGPETSSSLWLAIVAAVSYSVYGILYQRSLKDISVLSALPYLIGISAVITTIVAFAIEGPPCEMPTVDILIAAFVGAFLAVPIYILYNTLIAARGAFLASLISVFAPTATLALALATGVRPSIDFGDVAFASLGSIGVAIVVMDRRRSTKIVDQRSGRTIV